MNRILLALLILSGVANAFLLYRAVDTGVTTTYQSAEIKSLLQQQVEMKRLMPLLQKGISRDTLVSAAHEARLEIMQKEPNRLYVGTIEYLFTDDRVSDVRFE
jgi:hypothetical protein